MKTIFWFRRDLRLEDNAGLFAALSSGKSVIGIFVFDSNILAELPQDDARVSFIYQRLQIIDNRLKACGSSLAILHGDPAEAIPQFAQKEQAEDLYCNEDYEPYGMARDALVKQKLQENSINFYQFKDHVVFSPKEILKENNGPYVVYTPYSNRWRQKLPEQIPDYRSESLLHKFHARNALFPALSSIGFAESPIKVPDFNLDPSLLLEYQQTRNVPSVSGTSAVGPHLRFGSVSIRSVLRLALQVDDRTFINELAWREFFIQILYHFPYTVGKSFRPAYDNIKWRNDEKEFQAWCDGKTGYPIVDAGMRQLKATGTMHNRVRMITASFLCKHLLIDWRWGEAYFALKLLDYEQASNVGNWQWAAGTGVDAAPYFRIFNPSEQQKKFDKEQLYILKWVPEVNTDKYSQPIVDHKFARERCLDTYKQALAL